jgi:hypothetical protein
MQEVCKLQPMLFEEMGVAALHPEYKKEKHQSAACPQCGVMVIYGDHRASNAYLLGAGLI